MHRIRSHSVGPRGGTMQRSLPQDRSSGGAGGEARSALSRTLEDLGAMRTSQGDLISRSEREDPLGEIGSLSAASKLLKLGELGTVELLKLLELPACSFEAGIRDGKILTSTDVQRSGLRQRPGSDFVRPGPPRSHREIVTADADHSPL